jgi:hypothetical protein
VTPATSLWDLRAYRPPRRKPANSLDGARGHNGSLTNVAEELIVSARWASAFGESGGRDEDTIRDSDCRCCIEHRASRGCRYGQVSAGRTVLSAAATGAAGVQLDRMLSGHSARRRLCRQQINGNLAGFLFIENDSAAAVIAGGQAGCDLQFARNWVIGAQIDGAWTHLSGSEALTGTQGLPPSGKIDLFGNLNFKVNAIATATCRIGYAVNYDSIAGLFYLKGGGAFVDYDTSTFNGQLTACAVFDPTKGCTGASVGSAVTFNAPSANRFGWTIGVGT